MAPNACIYALFAKAGDVFRSEPTTRPGALALLRFVGEMGNAFAEGKEEAPGAIFEPSLSLTPDADGEFGSVVATVEFLVA